MNNVGFVYIEPSTESAQALKEIKEKHIQDLSKYGDNDYLSEIFNYLSDLYVGLASSDKMSLISEKEEDITDFLKKRLQSEAEYAGYRINSEARNQSNIIGYYDLKIEHSYWNNYFVLECKRLNEEKNKLDAYIHNKISTGDDGGLYRFCINKYSENKPFGGMLGYVISGCCDKIITDIKQSIKSFSLTLNNITYAELIDDNLLNKSINNISNTFQSQHSRINQNQLISPIHIFHFIFDFTK